MIQSLLLTVTLLPAAPVGIPLSSPAAPLLAQDDEEEKEKPDKRPEIKALLGRLKDHAGARGKEDNDAIGVVDELLVEFGKSGLRRGGSMRSEIGDYGFGEGEPAFHE